MIPPRPALRVARREPVPRCFGGVELVDPYAWLEEDSPEAVDWQEAQSSAAERHLRGRSYELLQEALTRHAVDLRVFAPHRYGQLWFQQVLPQGAEQPVLQVSASAGEPGRVLVDPNVLATDHPVSLDFFFPSPSGLLVAYGVSASGSEQSTLHVVDVETGKVLDDSVPLAMATAVVWSPDESGFWFSDQDREAATFQLALHRLELGGTGPQRLDQPAYAHPVVFPQLDATGRYLLAVVDHLAPRPHHYLDLSQPQDGWQPFLLDATGCYLGALVGPDYVALTTEGAPRGRVVAVPLASPQDRSTWRELVPESETVLRNLARLGPDHLLVSGLVDASSSLTVHDLTGHLVADVPMPASGTAGTSGAGYNLPLSPMAAANSDTLEVSFVHASFGCAPAVYLHDAISGEQRRLTDPAAEVADLTVTRREAPSADGALIPYRLVHRADLDTSVPQPVLMYGYGGYNVAFTPGYLEHFAPFVEAGGILVFCHLRGGGEYGEQWWHAGRLHHKQNTFDDLFGIAEQLVADGVTATAQLAVVGGSNGGLLAGAALAQRPDLFAAGVADRPVLDLLSLVRDPYTLAAAVADYGNPYDPAAVPALLGVSAYHCVPDQAALPATLVVCGAQDPRCPPWHGRKYVARMQAANTGDTPVLLRVWADTGHLGTDTTTSVLKNAEWLGFVMDAVGLQPGGS